MFINYLYNIIAKSEYKIKSKIIYYSTLWAYKILCCFIFQKYITNFYAFNKKKIFWNSTHMNNYIYWAQNWLYNSAPKMRNHFLKLEVVDWLLESPNDNEAATTTESRRCIIATNYTDSSPRMQQRWSPRSEVRAVCHMSPDLQFPRIGNTINQIPFNEISNGIGYWTFPTISQSDVPSHIINYHSLTRRSVSGLANLCSIRPAVVLHQPLSEPKSTL